MTTKLLLSVFPTFAVGGAQIRFATLANHYGRAWRHAIVSMDGDTTARERLDPGLTVDFPHIQIAKGDLFGNVQRFRSALRELRPATLLTHNFGSIEWSIANRLQVVHQIHVEDGFGPEEWDRQLPRRVWLRRLFLSGRTVALPSQTLMRIARETWRLNQRRLRYVPNGIDLDRFGGPTPAQATSADGPVIGTIAALRPEKNIARLIRAFRLATVETPARLTIIGDGPERSALETLVDKLELRGRVHFTGHAAQPASLIKALDVFALSSDTEQMPISLLEAMAAALPVVATDVGDIRSMLPNSGHVFVTPKDDALLGNALKALIDDEKLRAALGRENREKAERDFDQCVMFERWADLLNGTVAAEIARY